MKSLIPNPRQRYVRFIPPGIELMYLAIVPASTVT